MPVKERYERKGQSYINRAIQRKIVPLGVGCLIAMFALTLYVGSLFELSNFLVENDKQAAQAVESVQEAEKQADFLNEESSAFLKERAALAAYVVGNLDRGQLSQGFMKQLASALRSPGVWYYDMDGNTVATDGDFWGYRLSDDPEGFSYQFRQILNGKYISVVTDSVGDTGDWADTRYAGYAVQDAGLRTVGAVEIGLDQSYLEKVLAQHSLSAVLGKVQPGANGFAFAVDTSSKKIAYHPESWMVGTAASEHGISDKQLIGGFSDFMTIEGGSYLCASAACGNNLIYVAVPGAAPLTYVVRFVLLSTLFSALAFALILRRLLRRTPEEYEALICEEEAMGQAQRGADDVDVSMADGRVERSRSVLSRWSGHAVPWRDLTAGQKVPRICQTLVTLVAVVFLVLTLMADALFDKYSLFHYVLNGTWAAGFNLFAVTRCVMVGLVAYAVVEIASNMIRWFAAGMGPKGETACRLVANFLKFVYAIGMIYFCLGTLGVDTSTLLTSAGILALVIGLGANSLITDVLAGLFIVFEGEFQVGDIVTIGDFRGTVLEIGVRTTKVKDGAGNIKVFANRNVTNVLNMTKDLSVVICDMGIEYGESLEYVESILAEELPRVKKRVPAIVEGPFYKGITELADSSVNLRLVAQTAEKDRAQADRDLRREMKLIFDRYGINIPYPQVSLNQPATDFHAANWLQKVKADRFSSEQGTASKEVRTGDES